MAVILGIVLLQAFDTGPSGPFDEPVDVGSPTTTEFETDTTVDGGTDTTAAERRPPAEVKVLVANGAGIPGFAAKTANSLRSLGYPEPPTTDATRRLESTSVQYSDEYQEEAAEVARALDLPGDSVQPFNNPPVRDVMGANVIVLLGTDSASTTTTTRRGATTTTRRSSTTTTTPD